MASRSLGQLTVDILVKAGAFKSGMNDVERAADKAAKSVERSNARMAAKLDKIFSGIGKAASVGLAGATLAFAGLATAGTAVARGMKSAIDQMDDLSKGAQKVGVSTESFSKLVYAGELADVSMEKLQTSLGKLVKSQFDVMKGTPTMAAAFEALGIDAIDPITGKLTDQMKVLEQFADRWKESGGSSEMMAIGFEIFGRSFQDLIPLLKDGSEGLREAGDEAERFGRVVSTEAGQQAEEFNDNLTRLQSAVHGLFNVVASDMLPILVDFSNQIVEWSKDGDNAKVVVDGFKTSLNFLWDVINIGIGIFNGFQIAWDSITYAIETAINKIYGAINAIKVLGTTAWETGKALASFNPAAAIAASAKGMQQLGNISKTVMAQNEVALAGYTAKTKANLADIAGAYNRAQGSVFGGKPKTMNEALGISGDKLQRPTFEVEYEPPNSEEKVDRPPRPSRSSGGGRSAASASREVKEALSEEAKEAQKLQENYEALIEQHQRRMFLLENEGEMGQLMYDLQKGSLAGLTDAQKEQLKLEQELYDAASKKKELEDEAREKRESDLEYAAKVIEDMEHQMLLLGKTADEQERLNMLRDLGSSIGTDVGDKALQTLDTLQQQRDVMSQQVEVMDTVRESFSGALKDWISGTKSFKDAFLGALDSIISKILDIITQNLIAKMFGEMGSAGGGSMGGGLGSLIGQLLGGGGGGWGFASGGNIMANQVARVNEMGPELLTVNGKDYLMMGQQSGNITPNHMLGKGGGMSQVNNFTIQGRIDRRTEQQIAAQVGQRAQLAQQRNK